MTPDEFQKLCTSCKTPLAFAESCSALTEADRKKLSKTAQEAYKVAVDEERGNWRIPSHQGGIAQTRHVGDRPVDAGQARQHRLSARISGRKSCVARRRVPDSLGPPAQMGK